MNQCGFGTPKSGYGQIQRTSVIMGLAVSNIHQYVNIYCSHTLINMTSVILIIITQAILIIIASKIFIKICEQVLFPRLILNIY